MMVQRKALREAYRGAYPREVTSRETDRWSMWTFGADCSYLTRVKMEQLWGLLFVIEMVIITTSRVSSEQKAHVTEININGSVSVSIKSQGEVTALLFLLSPLDHKQVTVNTSCSDLAKGTSSSSGEDVTSLPPRVSAARARPTLVSFLGKSAPSKVNKIIASEGIIPSSVFAARNCLELQEQGEDLNGVYLIYPFDCCPNHSVKVYCDLETDGGGWTLIQRRGLYETQEDFFRGWQSYVDGFGDLSREFWLGLDIIHALANQSESEIRFELEDFEGEKRWAKYSHFHVSDASTDYRMEVSGYSGNAKDSFTRHNNMPFATKDHESSNECASTYKGAWWYSICHDSNLNGQYLRGDHESYADGVNWRSWKGYYYSLKSTEMKMRPAQ